MPQQELLRRVLAALEAAGIDYMLSGSLASSAQGEPRATHDIDLVVSLRAESVPTLVGLLEAPEIYIDRQAALEAVRTCGLFNLIDTESGDKVDFWLLTEDPFDAARFSRRRLEHLLGTEVMVSSPEDTILAKLRWAKLAGGSQKQFSDALSVYEVQAETLDTGYLRDWAARLAVEDLLDRLIREAETL